MHDHVVTVNSAWNNTMFRYVRTGQEILRVKLVDSHASIVGE